MEFALAMPQLIQGHTMDVSRGVNCRDVRKPLGVVVSVRGVLSRFAWEFRYSMCVWLMEKDCAL